MSSLLEMAVVLPLLLGVVVMDNAAISAGAALCGRAGDAYADYAALLGAVEYSFEASTGNMYPHGGGCSCESALP
ncbi:MAG TPA: hypothetical protein P5168_02670 [Candidatus Methanomethylicus sp.]|nr:hypothetical protein [Candidatus Methanomethylicus sp.]